MSYTHYDFMTVGLIVTVALFILAAALAPIANVAYRSVLLQREIATRRVLGARRSHIIAMFLIESMPGVWIGILVGALVSFSVVFFVARLPASIVLISAALVLCSATAASWVAARHAANTPLRKSGLFCAGSDKRGE